MDNTAAKKFCPLKENSSGVKKAHDPRHLARRLALQVLFAWNAKHNLVQQSPADQKLKTALTEEYRYWQKNPLEEKKKEFKTKLTRQLLRAVLEKYPYFDQLISSTAPEWPLPQIAAVDLAILRLALAELTSLPTPYKVVIDEAVELGKEFGGENSSKFVNGVLGTIVEKLGLETEEEKTAEDFSAATTADENQDK